MERTATKPEVVLLLAILPMLLADPGCAKREDEANSGTASGQILVDQTFLDNCRELAERQVNCTTAFEGCTQAPGDRGAEQGFTCYCYYYWCMHGRSGAEGDPLCKIR